MTRLRLLFFFTHWVKGTLSPTHYINGGFLLLLIPIQEVGSGDRNELLPGRPPNASGKVFAL